jgi:hypothetical protein
MRDILTSYIVATKASTYLPPTRSPFTLLPVAPQQSAQAGNQAVVFLAETVALVVASTAAALRPPVQHHTAQLSTRMVAVYTPPYGRHLASKYGTSLPGMFLQTSGMATPTRLLGAHP